jgi:hypothetical protein
MVRSTHLTPEYLVRAIKAGDCYASSGVTLTDVRYDDERRTLELEIEPNGDATFVTQFVGTLRAADTSSEAVVGPSGKPPVDKLGKPLRASRKYSGEIGKVLKTIEGLSPKYELTGDELYVRAVVTSSEPPQDPSFKEQRKQAWTQPVGWENLGASPPAAGK